MSNRLVGSVPLATALLAFSATAAFSQQSTTRGLTLGAHIEGASLSVEGNDPDGGGGFGVRGGYGFNRIVTIFLQIDGASVETTNAPNLSGTWNMAHGEVGARFHFANALRRAVPFLEVAVGGRGVSVSEAEDSNGQTVPDVSFKGSAFSVGGGLSYYLKQTLALDVEVVWTSGEFTSIEVGRISVSNLDLDAKSARLNLGVAWWP